MKFNKLFKNKRVTTNHEGAKAYMLSPKMELYSAVVASSLNDKFYEKSGKRIARIRQLIAEITQTDPLFVAKLAVYAREKMYLRSVPLVLTVELAKLHNGDNLIRRMSGKVIRRADEITEMLAYYQMANSRSDKTKKLNKISKQLQHGIADAFNKFDAYQFAKYNRSAEITLKDALFLVHPKAKNQNQQTLFDKIASDTLETAYTWETEMSAVGQQDFTDAAQKTEAVKNKWETLITSGKMGYMALLRNLRNILQSEVSAAAIDIVVRRLSDAAEVRKAKQMPFRFLAAYRELRGVASGYTPAIMEALEKAILASIDNVKGFGRETRVLIASDTSGSMQTAISPKSKIKNIDIGITLSMLLKSKCQNVITGIFGTDWKVVQMPPEKVLANVEKTAQIDVGWATNGYKVIDYMIRKKIKVEKVMIFTDMQLWNSNGYGADSNKTISALWQQYKKIAPGAKIYIFDLAGYGQSPIDTIGNDVFMIAGWSDKIFDILYAIENGSNAIEQIERVEV